MRLFYFSVCTVLATWLLLVIGGLVNPMGASLACPDWYFVPTCNGELFPKMTGGVLYEHGHRLWASMVGVMTLTQTLWIWNSRAVKRRLKLLSLLAVLLVAVQGTLGGVTVLLGLSAVLSTLHLVVAMVFFCLLIYISFGLHLGENNNPISNSKRVWIGVATVLTLVQILLGGIVRHVGAGLACGNDWISCGPSIWPSWYLGQLHMMHRFVGYALTVFVVIGSIQARRQSVKNNLKIVGRIYFYPALLVVLQIGLGLATVYTVRAVEMVFLHTAVGALLLGSQFLIYLCLGDKSEQRSFKSDLFNAPSHIQSHLASR